ncbi:hypothetical protein N9887_02020 [Flavobacteriaceae bacterium]|nr:hypothetical protein [Flavobacteriaceae bacterium]
MSKILFANAPKVTSFWSLCNGALSVEAGKELITLELNLQV